MHYSDRLHRKCFQTFVLICVLRLNVCANRKNPNVNSVQYGGIATKLASLKVFIKTQCAINIFKTCTLSIHLTFSWNRAKCTFTHRLLSSMCSVFGCLSVCFVLFLILIMWSNCITPCQCFSRSYCVMWCSAVIFMKQSCTVPKPNLSMGTIKFNLNLMKLTAVIESSQEHRAKYSS